MTVTPTNGDYRYAKTLKPADAAATGSIDDVVVATIVQHVMAALPSAGVVPSTGTTTSSAPTVDVTAKSAWLDFAQALASLVAASQEFRTAYYETLGKSPRAVLQENGIDPGASDNLARLDGFTQKTKGGTVVRAFWWGFHIEISHEDLQVFLGGANAVNTIVGMIGGNIPSPAQPFIKLAAMFVATVLSTLETLDRGRGVYVSMSWFAPGIFVPTSVV